MTAMRMTGRREQPAESCEALSAQLLSLVRQLQKLAPSGAKWSILTPSYKRAPVHSPADLTKHLAASRPSRASERVRGAPTHSATLLCSAGKTDSLHLALRFGVASDPAPRAALTVQLSIHAAVFDGAADPRARAVELFGALVSKLELDTARAISGAEPSPPPSDNAVRLGFLTLFPSRFGPLPPLPPGSDIAATLASGCVLAAHRGLPEPQSVEQATSRAHLRFVLGARVLLDGPAIPPPGFAAPSVAAEPAPVTPPEDIPTYLKVASEKPRGLPPVSEQAPAPPPPLSPAAASAFPVETGAIDVAKILKAPLPFDPKSPPPGAAQRAAPPPPPPPQAMSAPAKMSAPSPATPIGATSDIRVTDLLKRGPAVPFAPASPAATAPEPPSRAPSPQSPSPTAAAPPAPQGRGRWIRFNAQTGEPLAKPYWEELPPEAK